MTDLPRLIEEAIAIIRKSNDICTVYMQGLQLEEGNGGIIVPGQQHTKGPNPRQVNWHLIDTNKVILASQKTILQALQHIHLEIQELQTLIRTVPILALKEGPKEGEAAGSVVREAKG